MKLTRCSHPDCQALICFMPTANGKQMPIDIEPTPEGKWVVDIDEDGKEYVRRFDPMDEHDTFPETRRHTSHFETCPFAKQFSKKKAT